MTLTCCVCGDEFTEDDSVIRLTAYRYATSDDGSTYQLLRSKFDDQTEERFSHMSCAAQEGSLFLIGADGERDDV